MDNVTCKKPGCDRPATWVLIAISDPMEQIPACKRDIPSLMKGREEHVLYPYVVEAKKKAE